MVRPSYVYRYKNRNFVLLRNTRGSKYTLSFANGFLIFLDRSSLLFSSPLFSSHLSSTKFRELRVENGNSTRTMISPPFTFRRKFTNAIAALPRVRHSSCSWPVWEEEEKKKKRKRQAWYAPSYAYHYAYRRGTSSTTFRRLVDHLPSLLSRTTRVAEPRVASKPIRRRSSPPIKLLLNTRERTTHDSLLLSTGTSGSRAENRASLEPGCCRLERKRRYARAACRCLLVFKIRVAPRIDPRHCLFVTIRVTHVAACFRSSCSCARKHGATENTDMSETWFSR